MTSRRALETGESSDEVEIRPAADGSLSYTFGSDGVKMQPLTDRGVQIYALSDSGMPMSLMDDAMMGVDIPLGVTASVEGECTFSLPDPDAWDCEVWLIDRLCGSTVNLTGENYAAKLTAGDNNGRFYVHFGELQIDVPHRSEWKIYTPDGRLHVDGITEGVLIGVFDTHGICHLRTEARESTLDLDLGTPGVYIIVEL